MEDNFDTRRDEIITQIYDLIIKPEKANDFVSTWESYISTLSAKYDDRENATGLSDVVLSDDGLEVHFARVYAILESQGRNQDGFAKKPKSAGTNILFSFDLDGRLKTAPDGKIEQYQEIKCAADIAKLFPIESGKAWIDFLKTSKRAPSIDNLRLFALQDGGNFLAYNMRDENTGEVQVVVCELIVTWTPRLAGLLRDHFHLTKGELQLIEDLTRHGSLDAISKKSERSKHTLRTQLRNAFRKLNVTSQAAALQTVAMLAHFCETIDYEKPDAAITPDIGDITYVQAGDVSVPVHLFGPEDGHPVIFIHGMLDGVALNARVVEMLFKYGLRFVSPIRPNFGDAAPYADVYGTPEIFADQLKALVEQLDLRDAVLLGHMSGGLFGFAAAPKLGNRVAGLINISCGVPILSTKQFAKLSRRQKAFAYTTRYAPTVLPALLRVGVAQIDSIEIETLMSDMYPAVCPDRDLLEDPEISSVVLDGYRFAVAQGYKGFHGDALQVTRNWSDYVIANDKPVLLIHGHHDPAATFEFVAEFAQREKVELREYPKDGQLLLYGKPDEVLGDVRSFIDRVTAPTN